MRYDGLDDQYDQKVIKNTVGCWGWTHWTGGRYPRLRIGHNDYVYAHVYAYERFVGPVGTAWVLHRCDNKECTRPDHLYLGNRDDNGRDIRVRETSRKPACRKGHLFTVENTRWEKHFNRQQQKYYDARVCLTCERIRLDGRRKQL